MYIVVHNKTKSRRRFFWSLQLRKNQFKTKILVLCGPAPQLILLFLHNHHTHHVRSHNQRVRPLLGAVSRNEEAKRGQRDQGGLSSPRVGADPKQRRVLEHCRVQGMVQEDCA